MKTRTKITLTIVGLLAFAGLLYAANPTFFSAFTDPVGVAATPGKLFVSEFDTQSIDIIDGAGNISLFATIPNPQGNAEKYLAISPGFGTWALGYIYATQGAEVYKVSPDGTSVTGFATLSDGTHGCGFDHTGITFDQVGTFNYDMILTCNTGDVWRVKSDGTATWVANTGTEIEGPAVAPLNFGPYGGQIWAADENDSQVHAIRSDGHVTYNIVAWDGAEGVLVIPSNPCTFANSGAILVSAILNQNSIYEFSQNDLAGFGGNLIVTSETGAGIGLVSFDGTNYNTSTFDNSISGAEYEGSAFVDCQTGPPPPSPTPSPTPTATATVQPSPTPTPTAPPNCACAPISGYPSLGQASQFAVLAMNNPGPGQTANFSSVTVGGNVGIGAGATLKLQAPDTINGNLLMDPNASRSGPGTINGSVITQSLAQARTDAINASAQASALSPNFTYASITTNTTVNGVSGLNVVKITGNIKLSNASLTLSGPADAFFVVNVTGSITLGASGGIVVGGSVPQSQVLINATGNVSNLVNTQIGNVIQGTLLAVQGGGQLDGHFGSLILGRDFALKSNAVVTFGGCPCFTP